MWHSACSEQNSFSSKGLADLGGKHGSPAKQNLTTSLSTEVNPLVNSLSNDHKSDRIKFVQRFTNLQIPILEFYRLLPGNGRRAEKFRFNCSHEFVHKCCDITRVLVKLLKNLKTAF